MTKMQSAIFKTLVYADIFDFPLTLTELKRWLVSFPSQQLTSADLQLANIQKTHSYYHLSGRKSIVSLRRQRQRFSQLKLVKANRVVRLLKFIPFIKLIALTGALSMNNADLNDDIDILIITQTNRLWITRLLVVFLLDLFCLRRHKKGQVLENKFCLNLWLDQSRLALSPSSRNLYTAHEVIQIKPLLNRSCTYEQFISANAWIKNYLPNALPYQLYSLPKSVSHTPASIFNIINFFAFKIQYFYMKSHITNEKVSLHSAFFHPRPTSNIILTTYGHRLSRFGLKP